MALFNNCTTGDQKQATPEEGDFSNTLTQEEISNARLTPELLWKFGRLSDMQLSPDGITVIYTVTRYDVKTNKKHTSIFSVSARGGKQVNLTEGFPTCSNPEWIDNNYIAFLSAVNDVMQIWKMKSDGSDKQVISRATSDIQGFGFAGNGKRLYYLQNVKMDSTTQDKYPDLPLAKGLIIDNLMYRHWDSWNDYAYSHIFVADMEQDKVVPGTDIMDGQPYDSPLSPYFELSDIAWSPDGKKLAYTCKKLTGKEFAESTNSDIYLYDTENKITTDITEGMMGYDRYPVFSPDGKKLAFMSMETPGYESDKKRLFVIDLQTGTKSYITETLDQDASHFAWSADGKKLLFISGIKATYQIYETDPDYPRNPPDYNRRA